jgi:redox-sensitive bicupin YhaK (pirin superfamily)
MIDIRRAQDRGHSQHGWLDSYHTFSFANFVDSNHMGFRSLRVLNEDRVLPGRGFGAHAHRDMEIVSYVLEGALEHKDSMGHGSVIRPGELQLMRAGTGVTHSEYNHSADELVHFLQIWILPDQLGLEPEYAQRHFPLETRTNTLRLIASRDGREESVRVHQDAELHSTILEEGHSVTHELASGRYGWVQILRGRILLNGTPLEAGDGAAVAQESTIEIAAEAGAEALVFDLA